MCSKDGRTEEATNYSTTTAICSAFLCKFPGISCPSLPQNSKAISLSPKSEQAKKKPQKMSLNPQEQLRPARTTWQNEGGGRLKSLPFWCIHLLLLLLLLPAYTVKNHGFGIGAGMAFLCFPVVRKEGGGNIINLFTGGRELLGTVIKGRFFPFFTSPVPSKDVFF